jgi:hypothetical protein
VLGLWLPAGLTPSYLTAAAAAAAAAIGQQQQGRHTTAVIPKEGAVLNDKLVLLCSAKNAEVQQQLLPNALPTHRHQATAKTAKTAWSLLLSAAPAIPAYL